MNKQDNESSESIKNNSDILDLESLNTEYTNLLTEYELAVSNYINYLKQEGNQQDNQDMSLIKEAAFWGTSSLSESDSQTLEECKALCANTSGCTGATYNLTNGQTKCMLRSGEANIVSGSSNDVAIVPKGKHLLMIVKIINDKLTHVNENIQKLTQTMETKFNSQSENTSESNNILINNYNNLVEDRIKIKTMLKEYQTLEEKQVEGNIYISQNYYSFILLMILVIIAIFLLYKFSIPSAQTSTTIVQNGGQLGTSAYHIVFGIFLLIILLTYYNKYKLL